MLCERKNRRTGKEWEKERARGREWKERKRKCHFDAHTDQRTNEISNPQPDSYCVCYSECFYQFFDSLSSNIQIIWCLSLNWNNYIRIIPIETTLWTFDQNYQFTRNASKSFFYSSFPYGLCFKSLTSSSHFHLCLDHFFQFLSSFFSLTRPFIDDQYTFMLWRYSICFYQRFATTIRSFYSFCDNPIYVEKLYVYIFIYIYIYEYIHIYSRHICICMTCNFRNAACIRMTVSSLSFSLSTSRR